MRPVRLQQRRDRKKLRLLYKGTKKSNDREKEFDKEEDTENHSYGIGDDEKALPTVVFLLPSQIGHGLGTSELKSHIAWPSYKGRHSRTFITPGAVHRAIALEFA